MKFYNRVSEIKLLREIEIKSDTNAQFTVITGRRRNDSVFFCSKKV